tara:strand:- start:1390 stop:1602 length:213 start_codon:yes stop_codon:yes gene_type:complete
MKKIGWIKTPSNDYYYVGNNGTKVFLGRLGLHFNIRTPRELAHKRFRLKIEVIKDARQDKDLVQEKRERD